MIKLKNCKSIYISFIVLSVCLACIEVKRQDALSSKKYFRPAIGNIERKILLPGTIVPEKEIQVKSQISGILEELYVKIGDPVNKGQLIAKITPVVDPVSLERLERQYNMAVSNCKVREQIFQRNKALFDENAIAKTELEESERQYILANQEMISLKKELSLTRESAANTNGGNVIRATSEGTILELPVKVGGAVMARSAFHEGTTVATIANLDALIFQAKVLESDVAYLIPGMPLELQIGALKEPIVEAKLYLVSPKGSISDGSVKFDIFAKVLKPKNSNYSIRAGFSATAMITLEKKEKVLTVRENFLDFNDDSAYVTVWDSLQKIGKRTFVATGISDGTWVEIKSGIDTGVVLVE